MKTYAIVLVAVLLLAGILNSAAQNCGCSPDLCCSQWGYCGSDEAYCGPGCREGPCFSSPTSDGDVGSIVTDAFFNGIVDQSDAACEGRGFYTRVAFLEALGNYGQFGRDGSDEDSRREIAAFLHMLPMKLDIFVILKKEMVLRVITVTKIILNIHVTLTSYYGRGPIQLSWNYNYGAAGNTILTKRFTKIAMLFQPINF